MVLDSVAVGPAERDGQDDWKEQEILPAPLLHFFVLPYGTEREGDGELSWREGMRGTVIYSAWEGAWVLIRVFAQVLKALAGCQFFLNLFVKINLLNLKVDGRYHINIFSQLIIKKL